MHERDSKIFCLQLLEDPIFIPISQLEMHLGKPAEFLELQKHMLAGETDMIRFPKARDGKPRVKLSDFCSVWLAFSLHVN